MVTQIETIMKKIIPKVHKVLYTVAMNLMYYLLKITTTWIHKNKTRQLDNCSTDMKDAFKDTVRQFGTYLETNIAVAEIRETKVMI